MLEDAKAKAVAAVQAQLSVNSVDAGWQPTPLGGRISIIIDTTKIAACDIPLLGAIDVDVEVTADVDISVPRQNVLRTHTVHDWDTDNWDVLKCAFTLAGLAAVGTTITAPVLDYFSRGAIILLAFAFPIYKAETADPPPRIAGASAPGDLHRWRKEPNLRWTTRFPVLHRSDPSDGSDRHSRRRRPVWGNEPRLSEIFACYHLSLSGAVGFSRRRAPAATSALLVSVVPGLSTARLIPGLERQNVSGSAMLSCLRAADRTGSIYPGRK